MPVGLQGDSVGYQWIIQVRHEGGLNLGVFNEEGEKSADSKYISEETKIT